MSKFIELKKQIDKLSRRISAHNIWCAELVSAVVAKGASTMEEVMELRTSVKGLEVKSEEGDRSAFEWLLGGVEGMASLTAKAGSFFDNMIKRIKPTLMGPVGSFGNQPSASSESSKDQGKEIEKTAEKGKPDEGGDAAVANKEVNKLTENLETIKPIVKKESSFTHVKPYSR